MKARIIIAVLTFIAIVGLIVALAGSVIIDSQANELINKGFKRAIIAMPNGEVVVGDVSSWSSAGSIIQVKINGTTYIVSAENIVIISE